MIMVMIMTMIMLMMSNIAKSHFSLFLAQIIQFDFDQLIKIDSDDNITIYGDIDFKLLNSFVNNRCYDIYDDCLWIYMMDVSD